MKITQKQLRRIIREEISAGRKKERASLQNESMAVSGDDYWKMHKVVKGLLYTLIELADKMEMEFGDTNYDFMDASEELKELVNKIEGDLGMSL